MRTPIIAGNWKMNKTVDDACDLVSKLRESLAPYSTVERVVCPPATSLLPVSAILDESPIGLGAQNMHWEEKGAYTGELSPAMVKEFCGYVILGHSERREYFAETDQTVNKKVKAALNIGLTPIFCIGETLEQNEAGKTEEVLTRQIKFGLEGLSEEEAAKIVVAYEPIWAIGTGKAATSEDANNVIGGAVRGNLKKLFGNTVAESIRILYGGSVKPGNAVEYFGMSDIDGALVGGAALKVDDFTAIVKAAAG
ncbi:MAG: triose-phosphate isomerase [Anaerolineaceae bacterium]|nr:triose-phosphate isomerase [Anaerolineaceae bacterium]